MATYTVGPSATYANWAALKAAHGTLAGDDICEYQAATPGGSSTIVDFIDMNGMGSGTSGHNIIIRVRSGDTITINGNNVNAVGAELISNSFVTLDGFRFINQTNVSISGVIYFSSATSCTVQNCNVTLNSTASAATDRVGVTTILSTDCIIQDNTITFSGTWSNGDTDGIRPNGTRMITRHNTITISNDTSNVFSHQDGIQTTDSPDAIIERNIINMTGCVNAPCQGIFTEFYNSAAGSKSYGNCTVRNNVCRVPAASYVFNGNVRMSGPATKLPQVAYIFENNVLHNTNVAGDCVKFVVDTGTWEGGSVTAYNNIFYSDASGSHTLLGFYAPYAGNITCDYNYYYGPSFAAGAQFIGIDTTFYTLAQWKVAGYDTNSPGFAGGSGDPKLNAPASMDYTLQAASPAINAGVDLSGSFTNDAAGNTRSAPWEIGAYNYTASVTAARGLGFILNPH